jgi:hypothetical protein
MSWHGIIHMPDRLPSKIGGKLDEGRSDSASAVVFV